jgi:hypothetical protein
MYVIRTCEGVENERTREVVSTGLGNVSRGQGTATATWNCE